MIAGTQTERTPAGWNAEFERRRKDIEKDPRLRKAIEIPKKKHIAHTNQTPISLRMKSAGKWSGLNNGPPNK